MNKNSESENKFPLKKISVAIGIIGVIVGVVVGGTEFISKRKEARETRKQIETQLGVGKRFTNLYEFDRAVKEYEKVLELDKANIEAQREIISIMCVQQDLGIGKVPRINDILARIYRLKELEPRLNKDIELLIQEGRLLRNRACQSRSRRYYENCDRYSTVKCEAALNILKKAQELSPDNPEVLAQIGFIRGWNSSEQSMEIQDLLRATEIAPEQARYHYYLARTYDHLGKTADALKQYYEAATLADQKSLLGRKIYLSCLEIIDGYLVSCAREKGKRIDKINLPADEQLKIFNYLLTHYEPHHYSAAEARNGYMASLYLALGDYQNANLEMLKVLKRFGMNYKDPVNPYKHYGRWIHWFDLHIYILEKGELDPTMLADAKKYTAAVRAELARRENR